jgi:iron-sulfur cluster repair protein YtfE (RIC family)
MTSCDLDTSVPDWIIEHPETLAVFQELGIDYSCGGKSLAWACRERGLNAAVVLNELRRCLRSGGGNTLTEEMTNGDSSCEPRRGH